MTAIIDADGYPVVTYHYDPWGEILSIGDSMASTLGVHNPLLYRGYVYDHETGLYYLQSRYYNPDLRRFINADAFASTGQGFVGFNMFAYCLNNPVMNADYQGNYCVSAVFRISGGLGGILDTQSDSTTPQREENGVFETGKIITNNYDVGTIQTTFADIELGVTSSRVLSGDSSKPVFAYVETASQKWRVWEYKVGLQVNIGDGGFAIAVGFLEQSYLVSYDQTTTEHMTGINKIGFTQTRDHNFAERSGGYYTHGYIRTIPTTVAVLAAYVTKGLAIPALSSIVAGG